MSQNVQAFVYTKARALSTRGVLYCLLMMGVGWLVVYHDMLFVGKSSKGGAAEDFGVIFDRDRDILDEPLELAENVTKKPVEYRPGYIVFDMLKRASDSSPSLPLLPHDKLSDECIESSIVHDVPCRKADDGPKFDVVWTWVNGSDPLFKEELRALMMHGSNGGGGNPNNNVKEKMYRCALKLYLSCGYSDLHNLAITMSSDIL